MEHWIKRGQDETEVVAADKKVRDIVEGILPILPSVATPPFAISRSGSTSGSATITASATPKSRAACRS